MTAQNHIDAIGKAQIEVEQAAEDIRAASKRLTRAIHTLHGCIDDAQKAYGAANPSSKVVAFSGGTNKPPNDDPTRPVRPVR